MEIFWFIAGAGLGAVLTAIAQQRSANQSRQSLESAQQEIVLLRKQIQAQSTIYAQLEQRLIQQFSPFRLPENSVVPTPKRPTWRIGNTIYFNHDAYLTALEQGEMQRSGGYCV